MRLVLDTDVLLSGLSSPAGASRILLIAIWEGVIRPLAGVATMIEYEAVLKRPQRLAEMNLEPHHIDAFLDVFALLADPVVPYFLYRPSTMDPDDDMFMDIAVAGGAEALVTFNLKDYQPVDPAGRRFEVRRCRPGEMLQEMTWRPSRDSLSGFRLR
jgi:putative PIN family toxin of toxin-antitoxin system